jgi:hypothetical protein
LDDLLAEKLFNNRRRMRDDAKRILRSLERHQSTRQESRLPTVVVIVNDNLATGAPAAEGKVASAFI